MASMSGSSQPFGHSGASTGPGAGGSLTGGNGAAANGSNRPTPQFTVPHGLGGTIGTSVVGGATSLATEPPVSTEQVYKWIEDLGCSDTRENSLLELRYPLLSLF